MFYEIDVKDEVMFLAKFIKNPRLIGSVYPSSKYLAKKMLQPIKWEEINSVVELGAGTGVFTEYINNMKSTKCDAYIFEIDSEMRTNLKTKYPHLSFFEDAKKLSSMLTMRNLNGVDCIISGIPFAAIQKADRDIIIDEIVNSLNKHGVFVAFQYSLQMHETLKRRFSKVDISFEPRNIPPAFVYTCYK